MNKIKFSFLLGLAAFLVAGCAAYYSVFGLTQLFAGAKLAVGIMAGSLELSKLIVLSFLYRYWNKTGNGLKGYLSFGVIILVCITSAGIYGFLSNAYQKTANKLEIHEGELSVMESKKTFWKKVMDDNQKVIDSKTKRVDQLTALRGSQETRLDQSTNNGNRDKARGDIAYSSKEIQKLASDIDSLTAKNAVLSDSIGVYNAKQLELKATSSVAAEVGPLKYLAGLTGLPMDRVVNYFILLLICVFDPLAVALVIAYNKVSLLEKEEEDYEIEYYDDDIEDESVYLEEEVNETAEGEKPVDEKPEEEQSQPEQKRIKLEDIREYKERNKGFSVPIPSPKRSNNTIERIGSNKVVKDGNTNKVYFNRNK